MLTQAYLSFSATTLRSSSSSQNFFENLSSTCADSSSMTLTITIPRGIPGKQPPPNREHPDLSPLNPAVPPTRSSNQRHGDPNIELFRQMVKRTECGNIR